MEKVYDIARWFLSQDSMTHKKLQKLCYYAQAWHCALHDGTPLFEDDIQVWVHGPVVVSLYSKYADYRWNPIPKQEFDESVLAENTLELLHSVYNTYGDLQGCQLENLTQAEDPWKMAREDLKPWEVCYKVIPCSDMQDYYGKKYQQEQGK
ncbi:MAG: DUF4065 domain-containing protein [Planctomycetia bacterium]|nr:DUF4065 domain-containing protein [Planctomycetia bacterium]